MEGGITEPFVVNVELVAAIPITTFFRSCVLSASSDEIKCARKNGRLVFSGSPHEFHSYGTFMGAGFHLWHGNKRYRFMHWSPQVTIAALGDTRLGTDLMTDLAREVDSETVLTRLIAASPPAGLNVKSPMSTVTSMALSMVIVVAVVGLSMAVIVLASGPVSPPLVTMLLGIFAAAASIIGLICGLLYVAVFRRSPNQSTP
jgi:hypothetical protein